MGVFAGVELFAVPVGIEAARDLVDLVLMGGDDGVVARLGDVLGLPVERLDEGDGVVDDHRLFVGHVELGVAVADVNAGFRELFAGVGVFLFPVAPLGVEHDAHVDAAMLGCNDCIEEPGIGEDKHLDANGLLRLGDGFEDRLGGVVG